MIDSTHPPALATARQPSVQALPAVRAAARIGDRYQVLAELGRGGMGAVYRVRDPVSARDLALKQLLVREDGTHSRQATSLFEREFYVLAQLAHPRVIAVYDYGLDAEGPFYTMELLDGGDLKALSPLPVARACALMIEVCSSLALLHARRFVHRDITPRNIRCTRDGHAKLIDFGAMVPMGPCTHAVGTAAFIAPEVVHHSTLDARTDLFSLGATLYYTLTGQPPFAARELSDLRELWSTELVLPSRLVSDIPPALDTLCAALLRIDPAQRPRSAFEVMQRLQAVAGIEIDEPQAVEQAYLTTPALTGRDDVLSRFRHGMRRALHGEGSALLLESAPGLGRSRALDACVLEAKTLGAIVLRAAANASAETPFAVAQALAGQLLQLLPEVALQAANAAGVSDVLFEAHAGAPRVRALHDPALERATLQQALAAWIAQVCESHALLLAVDDVEGVDEASIALLAALALEAKDLRLVVQVTADSGQLDDTPPAFRVLAQHATKLSLRALSREQTEALLASVFGSVPNLPLLAERLFQIGLGNPRETMELARHLVGTGAVRYEDGQWSVPSSLDTADLPASAAEALAARVAALPPLARRLAESQALVGHVLRRHDYVLLAPEAGAAAIDAAISCLLANEIVQSDGQHYKLSQRALSDALCALLDPEHKRERHLALYELYRNQTSIHPVSCVHHLLEAEQYERALDVLASHEGQGDQQEFDASMRADPARLAGTLERALELAVRLGRSARQTHELRRKLIAVVVLVADDTLHARVAPAWLTQLQKDSGLADYHALDPALPASVRLQQALGAAAARFAAAGECDRVYRPDDAIKYLAFYVVISIVAGSRSLDSALVASLPELLEPFAPLSPVLSALWQNATALHEAYCGRYLQARDRWAEVYEHLGRVPDHTNPIVESVRHAVAQALAWNEATNGRADAALAWAAKLDTDPVQRVGAMYQRRLACVMHGDIEGADRFGKQAELLALRTSARQMFHPSWHSESSARFALLDLTGMKGVIDAIVPLAARFRGWRPQLRLAEGRFEFVRGDLTSARDAFLQAIALACPDSEADLVSASAWTEASAGLIAVAAALGDLAQAANIGERALAICAARGLGMNVIPITQQLSLVEAKLKRFEIATPRIEAVIEMQNRVGIRGLGMAQSYVTRARIAIWARDAAAAKHFTALAAAEPGGDRLLAIAVNDEPLVAEARRAGVELTLQPSAFEVSVLGSTPAAQSNPQAVRLRETLLGCPDAATRSARALELLCELADGDSGQLYLVGEHDTLTLAAASPGSPPNQDAIQFARGFFAQQIDDDEFTAGLTHATQMLSLPGAASYIDDRGRESRLFMLTCKERGALVYVGLAVLTVKNKARLDVQLAAHIAVLASCLLRSGATFGVRASELRVADG